MFIWKCERKKQENLNTSLFGKNETSSIHIKINKILKAQKYKFNNLVNLK